MRGNAAATASYVKILVGADCGPPKYLLHIVDLKVATIQIRHFAETQKEASEAILESTTIASSVIRTMESGSYGQQQDEALLRI